MWRLRILGIFILGSISTSPVTGIWSCDQDLDCRSLEGGVCRNGDCVCPPGKQSVLGGSVCVDLAPYHTSPCVEDHQCSRMGLLYECRRNNDEDEAGSCACQANHHYFLGRCWPTVGYGSPCTRSEECFSIIRDPYAMSCNATCQCSEGYYERQTGECRKIGYAVGDGCVLDADCQFEGGACDIANFVCYNINSGGSASRSSSFPTPKNVTSTTSAISRQHTTECDSNTPCSDGFECSNFGVCLCPVGYYLGEQGTCLAELGSPSTKAQCAGLLATVVDGICTCPPNFFFEENMRDCVRVTRRITDSCMQDSNCHTFGAETRCSEEQPPWGVRSCECIEENATWDANQQMCRLFARIGEECEVDSDCLAGDLEIQCVKNAAGVGVCTCPEGFLAVGDRCLTSGLVLGDTCQDTQECTGTPNTVCEDNRCSCDSNGYREMEDGTCAPIIGGVCEQNSDCVIENTLCVNSTEGSTCQCDAAFVVYSDACWPRISTIDTPCNVTAQCQELLGESSSCVDNECVCEVAHHYRDGGCWPVTGLFEACSRTSQCFLPAGPERTVCRNSICQCDFQYPYDEARDTCTSSASRAVASVILLLVRFALTKVVL
ncbi:EB module domain-containing protein [Phthorimaea operculella]|nr:EB module domain-containing protein [Phthorimaea operculella]